MTSTTTSSGPDSEPLPQGGREFGLLNGLVGIGVIVLGVIIKIVWLS